MVVGNFMHKTQPVQRPWGWENSDRAMGNRQEASVVGTEPVSGRAGDENKSNFR